MNTASGVAPAAQLSLEVGADEPPLLRHLWRLRTAQGLSQEELADRAGCDQATISRAERGRNPSPAMSERIAAALGVTVEQLVDHDPNAPPAHSRYLRHKMERGLLDAEEVAVACGLRDPEAVLYWARKGKLSGERYSGFGRRPWLFPPSAIAKLQRLRAEARAKNAARIVSVRGTTPRRGVWRDCTCECGELVYLRPYRAKEREGKPVFVNGEHESRHRPRYRPLPLEFPGPAWSAPHRRKHKGRAVSRRPPEPGKNPRGRPRAVSADEEATIRRLREEGRGRRSIAKTLTWDRHRNAEEGECVEPVTDAAVRAVLEKLPKPTPPTLFRPLS